MSQSILPFKYEPEKKHNRADSSGRYVWEYRERSKPFNLIHAGDMLFELHAEKITNRCSGNFASYHCQGDPRTGRDDLCRNPFIA
ncbi:MAG TPA: hypothetical protein VMW78_02535 [Anaerolineae bacterium]|nr:hypothetical protein [Anaerolineae bacterium]